MNSLAVAVVGVTRSVTRSLTLCKKYAQRLAILSLLASEHPVEKSKTKPGTGTHCRGVAADLAVSHQQAKEVLVVALQMDVGGVGVHQKGDGRFIHIDVDIDRRSLIWTY